MFDYKKQKAIYKILWILVISLSEAILEIGSIKRI